MFNLDPGRISDWIRARGYSVVALQLPEGLKTKAFEISEGISESTGATVIILGDPCYGACDVHSGFREIADALVHIGHSKIPSMGEDPDVLFIEAFHTGDVYDSVCSMAGNLPEKVGVLATVQYVSCINDAVRALEDSGKKAFVGKGDDRICHDGQVLGCNVSVAESVAGDVDGYLFLGEGDFHPLAASFSSDKPVTVLNPLSGEVRSLDGKKDRILRVRFAAIERARHAESFLIIECLKEGQSRPSDARRIADIVKSKGKKAYVIAMREISPAALKPYRVDAYICTACPRIAMDDAAVYEKPMLTVTEAEVALGLREWEGYAFDAIRPDGL